MTFSSYLSRSELWIVGSALVAFLVGTWVLRGAPPGQAAEAEEDADAPRAGYRDRIVVAVVVGLILILGGAYRRRRPRDPLVAADLRPGVRPGPDLDRGQPPVPARQPQPAPHDRLFERVS